MRYRHGLSNSTWGVRPALVFLMPFLSSCGLVGNLFPSATKLTITARPTGCGVVIEGTDPSSWSVAFTGSGAPAGATYQWYFTDGTSAVGERVVHTFDTKGQQNVKFRVTLLVGTDSNEKEVTIPLTGTLDGGPDPDGDTCIPDDGHNHVAASSKLCYNHNPPASGNHYSGGGVSPVAPGFYEQAVAVEAWVHNLEHGTVVLLYDCGAAACSDDLKNQLRALFDSVPPDPLFGQKKMIITPYAGIQPICTGSSTFPASGPFLAIAWNVQRAFQTLDTQGIIAFYKRHLDRAREAERIPQ